MPRIFFVPAAFLPGLRVTVPSAFSSAPLTLSVTVAFLLWWVLGALFLVTPAPVVDFLVVDLLEAGFVVVVVDLRLRSGVVEIDGKTRGLE